MGYRESAFSLTRVIYNEANRAVARAIDAARQPVHRDRAAQYEAGVAVRDALFGVSGAALRDAESVRNASPDRDARYGAALAFGLSGDSAIARRLADDLATRFPEDTQVKFSFFLVLRAVLALNDRDPANAIETAAAGGDLRIRTLCCSVGFTGSLYPIYVRGMAYLTAHNGLAAAKDSRKSWITAGSLSRIQSACLPDYRSAEPTRSPAMSPGRKPHTRTF